MNKQINT